MSHVLTEQDRRARREDQAENLRHFFKPDAPDDRAEMMDRLDKWLAELRQEEKEPA